MYRCPVPGCNHVAAYTILNSHAQVHGFKRMSEVYKKYGKVAQSSVPPKVAKWAQEATTHISPHHFDGNESAAARLKKAADEKKSR